MKKGIIGSKLAGDFTQRIFHAFGYDDYDKAEMTLEELTLFIKNKEFEGIHVTFPYKQAIYNCIDVLSPEAMKTKAVDTIQVKNNKTYGYNTDYTSLYSLFQKHNVSLKNKKILILGNGGSSQAVQTICQEMEAKEVNVVDIVNSSGSISYTDCYARHLNSQIVINTTSVGMYPDIDATPISISLFPRCELLVDLVSNPIVSHLSFEAKELGIKRINGIEMEVIKARDTLEIINDTKIHNTALNQVLRDILTEKQNIVLIGMPSAGKTTIGQKLSAKLNKSFIDLDDTIVDRTKCSIPDIFSQSGEAGFRKLESMVTYDVSKLNNVIIGTGGGTIKNKINMDYLRLNGIVFFIDRDLEHLISNDPNRPLSSSEEAVKKLYEERYPLYKQYADAIVSNNDDIETTVEEIIKNYYRLAIDAIEEE